jgi:hypothetical protein
MIAMNEDEITARLSLKDLVQTWHIQKSCARTGEGLIEGFRWIAKQCTQ